MMCEHVLATALPDFARFKPSRIQHTKRAHQTIQPIQHHHQTYDINTINHHHQGQSNHVDMSHLTHPPAPSAGHTSHIGLANAVGKMAEQRYERADLTNELHRISEQRERAKRQLDDVQARFYEMEIERANEQMNNAIHQSYQHDSNPRHQHVQHNNPSSHQSTHDHTLWDEKEDCLTSRSDVTAYMNRHDWTRSPHPTSTTARSFSLTTTPRNYSHNNQSINNKVNQPSNSSQTNHQSNTNVSDHDDLSELADHTSSNDSSDDEFKVHDTSSQSTSRHSLPRSREAEERSNQRSHRHQHDRSNRLDRPASLSSRRPRTANPSGWTASTKTNEASYQPSINQSIDEPVTHFVARPLPKNILGSQYKKLLKQKQRERKARLREHTEAVNQSIQPFKFEFSSRLQAKREMRKLGVIVSSDSDESGASSSGSESSSPVAVAFGSTVRDSMKQRPSTAPSTRIIDHKLSPEEQEAARRRRRAERMQQLMENSSLPPRMAQYQEQANRDTKSTSHKRNSKHSSSRSHKIKRCEVPDFASLHASFDAQRKQRKQSRPATQVQPFNITDTNQPNQDIRSKQLHHQRSISDDELNNSYDAIQPVRQRVERASAQQPSPPSSVLNATIGTFVVNKSNVASASGLQHAYKPAINKTSKTVEMAARARARQQIIDAQRNDKRENEKREREAAHVAGKEREAAAARLVRRQSREARAHLKAADRQWAERVEEMNDRVRNSRPLLSEQASNVAAARMKSRRAALIAIADSLDRAGIKGKRKLDYFDADELRDLDLDFS